MSFALVPGNTLITATPEEGRQLAFSWPGSASRPPSLMTPSAASCAMSTRKTRPC